MHWGSAGAGFADLLELEERRPGDQTVIADGGEERDAPLERGEAGVDASRDDRGGQVDEFAVLAPWPGR